MLHNLIELSPGVVNPEITTGVIHDLPFSKYLEIPAISKSTLFNAKKCLKWFDHKLEEKANADPVEEKTHFSLGRAVHTKCFEPDLFDSLFSIVPKVDKRTKKGKADYANFLIDAAAAGKQILDEKQMEQVTGMAESLAAHPTASNILAGGVGEVSIISRCVEFGVLRKCRLDWFVDNNLISDLKTTGRLASEDAVIKQIFDLGYYLQAAMYLDAASDAVGSVVDKFVFVFIETTAPYLIGLYEAGPDMIRMGLRMYRHLMENVIKCNEQNYWPHYNNDMIVEVEMKPWMVQQLKQDFRS